MKRLPLLCSFVLFILLCASVTYWLLQWMAPSTRTLQVVAPAEPALPELSAATQLFGGASTEATSTPLQLSGIIYSRTPGERVAIITSDAKPARALGMNAEVAPGIIIKQINQRSVIISEQTSQREIQLTVPATTQQTATPTATEPAKTSPPR
ncbi:MAG: type II secretion system protein N [Burkholderiaceae bacterium]